MDFKARNFSYASRTFGDFVAAIERGDRLYLRALSSKNAKELPTNLEHDYPSIASDFHLPGKPLALILSLVLFPKISALVRPVSCATEYPSSLLQGEMESCLPGMQRL
jgi:hypothetical protein